MKASMPPLSESLPPGIRRMRFLQARTPEEEQKALAEIQAREVAIKRQERWGRIRKANLPPRLMKNMEAALQLPNSHGWKQRLNYLKSRIEQPGQGHLYAIIGGYGTGKSQLGACLAYSVTETAPAIFAYAADLGDSIKDVYRSSAGTVIGQMDKFITPRLLVIDEVNAGLSEADIRYLQRIVCHRYDHMTATVLLSNELKPSFQALVGDRVVSRMVEDGGIIEANWPSFRKTT